MFDTISRTCSSFWRYYVELMKFHWDHMTPIKYGMLLAFIGIVGFLMMKSGLKRC